MDIILLIVGLVGLWLGTELTIRGAISIANKLGYTEFVVGVAISPTRAWRGNRKCRGHGSLRNSRC